MTPALELEKLAPSDGGEAVALEIAWARGSLDCHIERLLAFVDRNYLDIVQLAETLVREPGECETAVGISTRAIPQLTPPQLTPPQLTPPQITSPRLTPRSVALLDAVKCVVGRAGAVHLASEMRDQLQVIRDELWIRGERGDYDRAHITEEWTSLHAANWRRWRLKEYAFVIDRSAERILARLESAESRSPEEPRRD